MQSGQTDETRCAWCGEPADGEMGEWANPTPEEGGNITEIGHVGCQPDDWQLA